MAAAEALRNLAFQKGSADNITVMTIYCAK